MTETWVWPVQRATIEGADVIREFKRLQTVRSCQGRGYGTVGRCHI